MTLRTVKRGGSYLDFLHSMLYPLDGMREKGVLYRVAQHPSPISLFSRGMVDV